MGIQIINAFWNGPFCNHSIGIKKQHITSLCLSQSHIVGFSETCIEVIGNNLNLWEPFTEILHGAIGRIIVNHKYLRIWNRAQHGIEALLNVVPHLVADYDYAYRRHISIVITGLVLNTSLCRNGKH